MSIESLLTIIEPHQTFIEHLSNVYRTTIKHLLNYYWTSIRLH